jgi:hypothetical protein
MRWLLAQLGTDTDECAPFPFCLDSDGYGAMLFNGTQTSASRAMATLAHGEPEDATLEAAHSCRLRSCCNPRHIRWATHDENMQDMVKDGTKPIGERSGKAKLSEEQVMEIRALRGKVSQRKIAARFGVTQGTVCCILTNSTWRHI